MSKVEVKRSIEAILMVVDEPLAELVLAQIIEVPTDEIVEILAEMAGEYDEQGRGFQLRQLYSK